MSQNPEESKQPGHPYIETPQEPIYTEYVGGDSYFAPSSPLGSPYPHPGQWPIPPLPPPTYAANNYAIEPPDQPLSIREGLRQLPRQWKKLVWKPSPAKFFEEKGKGSWGLFWVAILLFSVVYGVLMFVQPYIPGSLLNLTAWLTQFSTRSSTPGAASIAEFNANLLRIAQWGNILFAGISYLIGEGIYFLFAKLFKGRGTFLQQVYANLLYTFPTQLLLGIIFTLPFIGGVLGYIVSMFAGIYLYILRIFSTQAVHRLSVGKALGVVFLPLALWTVLGFVLGFVLAIILIMNIPAFSN